jgi:hypothetical protein
VVAVWGSAKATSVVQDIEERERRARETQDRLARERADRAAEIERELRR